MENNSEIEALLRLLQDNDVQVLRVVEEKLENMGTHIIPQLESAWETSVSDSFQVRVEQLIHRIQFESLKTEFTTWVQNTEHNLLEGMYLVAKYAFPNVQLNELKEMLQPIIDAAKKVKLEGTTALEKIRLLNHILFDVVGLGQNNSNFYAPHNSYLNIVLDQKQGNPISLSVVYLLVAQAMGFPVYGVNLPKNFILVYGSPDSLQNFTQDNLEFYINPYNKGAVLSAKEIEFFTKQQKLPHRKEFYLPCTVLVIIRRVLQNLIYAYKQVKKEKYAEELELLKQIVNVQLDENEGLLL